MPHCARKRQTAFAGSPGVASGRNPIAQVGIAMASERIEIRIIGPALCWMSSWRAARAAPCRQDGRREAKHCRHHVVEALRQAHAAAGRNCRRYCRAGPCTFRACFNQRIIIGGALDSMSRMAQENHANSQREKSDSVAAGDRPHLIFSILESGPATWTTGTGRSHKIGPQPIKSVTQDFQAKQPIFPGNQQAAGSLQRKTRSTTTGQNRHHGSTCL